jgi:hypothetical protein
LAQGRDGLLSQGRDRLLARDTDSLLALVKAAVKLRPESCLVFAVISVNCVLGCDVAMFDDRCPTFLKTTVSRNVGHPTPFETQRHILGG